MIHRISIHALLAESDYERSPISLTAAEFLSTPSLRRATADSDSSKTYLVISIHTLLAESDSGLMLSRISAKDFYPRPPCGERRRWQIEQDRRKKFLSTLSLRRATYESEHQAFEDYNFYPRSPCGERPYMTAANSTRRAFLSTLSLRRATNPQFAADQIQIISIHALLAESDVTVSTLKILAILFLSTLSLRRATGCACADYS